MSTQEEEAPNRKHLESQPEEEEEEKETESNPPPRTQPQPHHEPPQPVVDIVYDFIAGAATYLKQRFQYAIKEKKISHEDFRHDEEIANCIKILDRHTNQSKNLSRQLNNWLIKEKDFSLAETRHAHRMERLAGIMDPLQLEELLILINESLVERGENSSEYVETFANELVRPVDTFFKSNIDQTKLKKKECNMSSVIRENNVKAFNKVEADTEKKYSQELKELRKAKEESENHYSLISGELLMLVESLEFKNRLELPAQILATLDAREAYFKSCCENVAQLKKKLAPIIEELQSGDFKPQYRPPPEHGQKKVEESDEELSEDDDSDEEDKPTIQSPVPSPTSPPRQQ